MKYADIVLKKLFRGPNNWPWWAGLGPRALLCPPLIYIAIVYVPDILSLKEESKISENPLMSQPDPISEGDKLYQ